MRKIIFAIVAVIVLSSCGVGSYSVSSGRADQASISFTTAKATPIAVLVDGAEYQMSSVKDIAFKTDRKIKETSQNTLYVTPGTHEVKVFIAGSEVYSKKLFISASEHKIIEL